MILFTIYGVIAEKVEKFTITIKPIYHAYGPGSRSNYDVDLE